MGSLGDQKRAIRREEKTRKRQEKDDRKWARRAQRRIERECFWAWPWGHVYEHEVRGKAPHLWRVSVCRVCGKGR